MEQTCRVGRFGPLPEVTCTTAAGRWLAQHRQIGVRCRRSDLPERIRLAAALSPSFVFAAAACKSRRLLQGNATDERVGMTMHQLPFGTVITIDFSDA